MILTDPSKSSHGVNLVHWWFGYRVVHSSSVARDGTGAAGPSCVSMGGYLIDSYYGNLPHLRNGATKMVPNL